ncbi:hypothetical protein Y032_0088g2125 [Ancylostoma ceylanicum]|nr:hypothetical protein Y032_0088g2125 [Ancylostoma ceylanicum]
MTYGCVTRGALLSCDWSIHVRVAATPYPGPPQPPGPTSPQSPFPFPLTWEAQQELNKIQSDPNLTKQQYEDQMNQWATKYNVKDKYDAYKKNIDDQRTAAQKELDDGIKAVRKYFKDIRAIENDNTLTWAQAAQKKQDLFNKLTPKQQQAAQSLEKIFAPDFAKTPSPAPPRPGPGPRPPYRPWPYGQYWPRGPYRHCT